MPDVSRLDRLEARENSRHKYDIVCLSGICGLHGRFSAVLKRALIQEIILIMM